MIPDTIDILIQSTGQVKTLGWYNYVRGVVPSEVYASWPMAALRAQALAAGAYALYHLPRERWRHSEAPLCNTAHCQVWDPAKYHARTDEATQWAANKVVVYEGQPILAMYSAACGGHTLDGGLPYLVGVPCPERRPISGHRIGLCQWGAKVLADMGKTAGQIVLHYYRNTEIIEDAPPPPPPPPPPPTPPPGDWHQHIAVVLRFLGPWLTEAADILDPPAPEVPDGPPHFSKGEESDVPIPFP